jgi:phage regulator Rha-like protein
MVIDISPFNGYRIYIDKLSGGYMKEVIIVNNEPVVSSLIIAKATNTDHNSVQKLIKGHKLDLEQFGVYRLDVDKPKGKNGGRPQEIFYLNESQTSLLLTFMKNKPIVVEFKITLIKEFYKMKKAISQMKSRQKDNDWIETRTQGKLSRKNETDAIKEFVEYATSQGSKNASKYYGNITSMENKALFILEQKFPNVRELLTGQQLMVISTADQIVSHALKDGMNDNLNYKEIYQLAKERVETFASVMPKTPVIMLEECNEQLKLKETLK